MAIRSSSPIAESLLWKARLTQHNAHLKKEADALKIQVKELTERLETAEAKVQSVTNLDVRIAAIEADDKDQLERFAALDCDRRERLQNLEDRNLIVKKKLRVVCDRMEEMSEELKENAARREQDAIIAKQVQALETALKTLAGTSAFLTRELQNLQDASARETERLQARIKLLEDEVEAAKAQPRQLLEIQPNRNSQKITKPIKPKAKPRLAKLTPSVGQTKPQPQTRRTAANQNHVLATEQAETNQKQQIKIGVDAPKIWRSRTTRQGRSGWQQPQHLSKECAPTHPEQTAQAVVHVHHVQVAPSDNISGMKRTFAEDGEDLASRHASQRTKRAKNAPVTKGKVSLNLKTTSIELRAHETDVGGASMVAASTNLVEERRETSTRPAPTGACTVPTSQAANVLGTAQRPVKARPARLTKAKREGEYRPPVRVPNLPPTPPPPSP